MPQELITFGSRVTACDCLMIGRVNMVWRTPHHQHPQGDPPMTYYRVQFPPRSPFIGDWAIYRQGELALLIDRDRVRHVNIGAMMRPKFPRFHT